MSETSVSFPSQAANADTYGVYRIVRPIGEGASGQVFLAERTDFAQRVALKVFHSAFLTAGLSDEGSTGERHVLASLDHRHIVRVLQQGVTLAGVRYLAMEYVDGEDIVTFCDVHRLPVAARVRLLLQVLEAVEHAHRHLVVHGDLKPANVLVRVAEDVVADGPGVVKLVDFGVAAPLGRFPSAGHETTTAHTPAFAAPEQRAGARATVASDIYSLGVLGRRLMVDVPPRGDLDAIFSKAVAEQPEARYRTAEAMAADLHAYAEGRTPAVRHAPLLERVRKWALRYRLGAAMAALLMGAVLFSMLGITLQAARARRNRSQAEARLREIVQLTGTLESELYGSVRALPNAGNSRKLLTDSAAATLDALAAAGSQDVTLRAELASQYELLAQLEMEQAGHDQRASTQSAPPKALQHLQRALDLTTDGALRAKRIRMLQDLKHER